MKFPTLFLLMALTLFGCKKSETEMEGQPLVWTNPNLKTVIYSVQCEGTYSLRYTLQSGFTVPPDQITGDISVEENFTGGGSAQLIVEQSTAEVRAAIILNGDTVARKTRPAGQYLGLSWMVP